MSIFIFLQKVATGTNLQVSKLNATAENWISLYIEAKLMGNMDDIQ